MPKKTKMTDKIYEYLQQVIPEQGYHCIDLLGNSFTRILSHIRLFVNHFIASTVCKFRKMLLCVNQPQQTVGKLHETNGLP